MFFKKKKKEVRTKSKKELALLYLKKFIFLKYSFTIKPLLVIIINNMTQGAKLWKIHY